MSLSVPVNPPILNEAVASPSSSGVVFGVDENSTKINQLHGLAPNNANGAGIPKQVSNVQASVAQAQTGATCTVTILYSVDPTDKAFSGVNVWAKSYQGNPQLVQVSSGTGSPCKFVLNNTGENVSFTVQSFGNGGNAPLSQAPTCSASLPKSTTGGFGSSTVVNYNVTNPPPSISFAQNSGAMLIGPFLELPYSFANSYLQAVQSVNEVRVTRMYLPFAITLSKCTFTVNSGGVSSGKHFAFGFYTFAGAKVLDSDIQTVNANQVFTLSFTPVTLGPAVFYYAQTGDGTAPNLWGIPASSIGSAIPNQLNHNSVWFGTAANASVAGALPATLGALTADNTPSGGIVLAQWE